MVGKIVLIVGGARSGKSRFAQEVAREIGGPSVLFVATGQPLDPEMARRIEMHQRARPAEWRLLESPRHVGYAISQALEEDSVILIDCLTLLVSNVLCACPSDDPQAVEHAIVNEIVALLNVAQQQSATFVVVSGEVGHGLVPPSPLGRSFRDQLGWANQRIAAESDAVYLMVAGLPIEVKSLACSAQSAAAALSSEAELRVNDR